MPTGVKSIRRRWPKTFWSLLTALVLVAGGGGAFGVFCLQAGLDTVGEIDFADEPAIPPLAESEVDADGTRVFDLDLQAGETRFLAGPAARTWGVNGSYLGPTIRATRGEKVSFAVRNNLDEATSLHWHGMHVPAAMDGGPHQTVAPVHTGLSTPRPRSSAPAARSVFSYEGAFNPALRDYQARVTLTPTDEGGTHIRWHGTYDTHWVMRWFMRSHLRRFMQRMVDGLAAHATEIARE